MTDVSIQTGVGGSPMSRRTLLRRAGLAAGTLAVGGTGALGYRAYDQGVLQLGQGPAYEPWADWKRHSGVIPLVAAATLAPNPHNSQPWLFRVGSNRIDLFADASRNIGAIDPFKREKYIGLGAALENLVVAAEATGYRAGVTLMPEGAHSDHAARIELSRAPKHNSFLVDQIAKRHTNRYAFVADKDVPTAALAVIAGLGDASTSEARVLWFSSNRQRSQLGSLLVAATEAIIRDPDQSRSDYQWFRQTWDAIQRQRDGITIDASGLPELTQALAKLLPAQSRQATDDAWLTATRDRHTKTAAAYGIVAVRDATDNRQRLGGGRLLERVHLWTTGNGIALQHMNQLTERADRERELAIKPQFGDALAQLLPDGWQALSLFRIGYPTHTPNKSPRRAVEAVIVT
jgi:nitroreductase